MNLLRCYSSLLRILLISVVFISCKKEYDKPNIVIIFADDLGYQDLGCYGAKDIETPNIDKLAQQGTKFTQFYVSEAVCSASRASLLTGCYASRIGILGALMPWSSVGLNPDEQTMAELLKGQNYKTGIFGKWHLGHMKQFLPFNHGFDEFLGLPYSNDMWPVDYSGEKATRGRKARYPELTLIKDSIPLDTIRNLDDQAQLTHIYTKAAVEFIQKNKKNPFFLYVPHSMPHVPIAASERFKGKSKNGLYGDVIMEIDWSVGEIIKALNDCGLEDNTLVIFTSDNGPWKNYGNHAGSTGPLREGKGNMFEGGARVPCIMSWPGRIPENRISDELLASIDLLPTICKFTGAESPGLKIDGMDASSYILGEDQFSPRKEFLYYYNGGLCAVRKGDWKLIFPHRARLYEGMEPGKDGYPGPYNYSLVPKALYNLKDDIGEKQNVIDKNPDIVKQLEEIAHRARTKLGDQFTGKAGNETRSVGRSTPKEKPIITHLAYNKTAVLKKPVHPKYSAGEKSLVDGLTGTTDFNNAHWNGFEFEDFEITIDLEDNRTISEISCNFLQDQDHWIFLPKEVLFFGSNDGVEYEKIAETVNPLVKEPEIKIHTFKAMTEEASFRYVKVIGKNMQYCPDWHIGAGGRTWIFIDEVAVK